jgi:hypothetical protein
VTLFFEKDLEEIPHAPLVIDYQYRGHGHLLYNLLPRRGLQIIAFPVSSVEVRRRMLPDNIASCGKRQEGDRASGKNIHDSNWLTVDKPGHVVTVGLLSPGHWGGGRGGIVAWREVRRGQG